MGRVWTSSPKWSDLHDRRMASLDSRSLMMECIDENQNIHNSPCTSAENLAEIYGISLLMLAKPPCTAHDGCQ